MGLGAACQGAGENTPPAKTHLLLVAPDLVERNFVAMAPNKLWTADITYLSTEEGFLYLAFTSSMSTPARWLAGRWQTTCTVSW